MTESNHKFKKSFKDDQKKVAKPLGKPEEGTVEFLNINMLKKNSVRGLLRKRAKKYDCMQTYSNGFSC